MVSGVVASPKAPAETAPGYVTGVLLAGWILALLDRMLINILVPGIKASLHVSDTQVSLLQGFAFAIFFSVAGIPIGRLVDRANRRNLLIVGVLGWSLATMACGLASSFPALFAGRVMMGVFQAVLAPASLSMVADYCAADRRGRTTAVLVSGGTIGSAGSAILGGMVLQMFSGLAPLPSPFGGTLAAWQSTLIVAGLPGLLLAALLLLVREPERQNLAAAGDFRALTYISANRKVFVPLHAAFGLFLFAGYALAMWAPVILMRNLAMPPREAGLIVGGINLVAAGVAAFGGGFLSDYFERRDPGAGRLKLALLLALVSAVAILPLLVLQRPSILLSMFLFSALLTAFSSTAYTLLPELAPSEARGQVIAVFVLIGNIFGIGFAPTAIALVTDHVLHDEARVNVSMVLVAAPSLLLIALLISIALPHARRLRRAILAESAGT